MHAQVFETEKIYNWNNGIKSNKINSFVNNTISIKIK